MLKVYASGATRSRRVLWALEELGAPYEVVALKFPPRVHHPEFLAISPAGALPAIDDDGRRIIESLAICDHVNRKHGGDLVVEPHEPDHVRYLEMVLFGESTLTPPLAWARRFGPANPAILEEAREIFRMRVSVVEDAVADGREVLAAGRLTLADISVGYSLGLAAFSGLGDLIPPAVLAYETRLKARPAYQRAYAVP